MHLLLNKFKHKNIAYLQLVCQQINWQWAINMSLEIWGIVLHTALLILLLQSITLWYQSSSSSFCSYVLVLVFCYLRMRLCNGFKFKLLTLALATFWSSERYLSKPVYIRDCPRKGTRKKTAYIIYVSARTISVYKLVRSAQ